MSNENYPKTIEDLIQWVIDNRLDEEDIEDINIYIGDDCSERNAKGLYRDEKKNSFVYYMYDENIEKHILYAGPDEAYACYQIYLDCKAYLDEQKTGKRAQNEIQRMPNENEIQLPRWLEFMIATSQGISTSSQYFETPKEERAKFIDDIVRQNLSEEDYLEYKDEIREYEESKKISKKSPKRKKALSLITMLAVLTPFVLILISGFLFRTENSAAFVIAVLVCTLLLDRIVESIKAKIVQGDWRAKAPETIELNEDDKAYTFLICEGIVVLLALILLAIYKKGTLHF